MKRVALYVRVSTEEQKKHGISVDSQLSALQTYCKEKGYLVVKVYNDAGFSAAKSYKKRPAMQELLADADKQLFDLVLFTLLDRWFRSVGDYYEVQSVLDRNNIKWRTIWEDYNTESSDGIFKVNIMLSIAQAEAQRTSEKIKNVMQYKREKGDYVGKAPMGYIKKNNQLILNEDMKEGIQVFFDTFLATKSIIESIRQSNEYGLKMNRTQAIRILKSEVYCGHAKGDYSVYKFISEEEHQEILKLVTKAPRTSKKYDYVFTGIIVCECCGRRFAAKRITRQNKHGEEYSIIGYQCAGKKDLFGCTGGRYINEKKLEKYLLDVLDQELSEYNYSVESSESSIDLKKLENQKNNLKAKLNRIGDRYEDGDIDREEYKTKRMEVLSEINLIDSKLQNKPQKIELPSDWKSTYNMLSSKNKRAFWMDVFDKIELPTDKDKNPILFFKK